jgi:ferredoxin
MARNVLFYFTGTGNSLAVARTIAGATEAVLVPVLREDALDCIAKDTETVGLVYPVYMNAVPRVVEQLINKMTPMPSVYFYAIATHGGVPGMAGLYLNRVFKKRNMKLDAYFELEMTNNTPKGVAPKFLMNLNWEGVITPEKVDKVLGKVQQATADIARTITSRQETTLHHVPSGAKRVAYWMMSLIWSMSASSNHKLDFLLDASCTGCGTCERVCTTRRISMNQDKPQWIHSDCSFCYACFNFCPEQAIGVQHYTKKLGRYHHPEVSATDVAAQLES